MQVRCGHVNPALLRNFSRNSALVRFLAYGCTAAHQKHGFSLVRTNPSLTIRPDPNHAFG